MTTAPAERDEARCLLILDQTPGVGLGRIRALVSAFGSARGALDASVRSFAAVAGEAAARARSSGAVLGAVERGLALADRLGMTVLPWSGHGYPDALRHLADPPPVLFLAGRRELLGRPAVAVVGARRATARGHAVAAALGSELARVGVPVLSGMALGIDGAAHRGALQVSGDTVAVVARGGDAPYPPAHRRLFHQILEQGLVVSEFLPGTPPLRHHFPRRNRILAALAKAVVVVEAGARSGALITVEHALDLGREVWAVPGPIDLPSCLGSNRLLVDGARPLVSVEEFGAEMGQGGPVVTEGSGMDRAEPSASPPDPERRILGQLGFGPRHVDELVAGSGLEVSAVLSALTSLELRGAVVRLPGLYYRGAA